MEHIRQPLEFDFSTTDWNLPERCRKWKQTMKLNLTIAMNGRTDKEQCSASVLCCILLVKKVKNFFNPTTIFEDDRDKVDVLFQKFKKLFYSKV